MRTIVSGVVLVVACGGGGVAPDAHAIDGRVLPANVVFVSEDDRLVTGGLDAADTFCAEQAERYGLAGTYVAWLSTSTVAARDRLAGSRGWVRADGRPFVASIDDLVAGRMYYPPNVFPDGARAISVATATGTQPDGTPAPRTCGDWTSNAAELAHVGGVSGATTDTWTSAGSLTSCEDPQRLYCFGVGLDVDVTPAPTPGRLVFVSSPWIPGGGLADADAHCNADAMNAGRTGEFIAYLGTQAGSARTRLSDGAPWVRLDGIPIADTTEAALAGKLEATRNVMLDGRHISGEVWRDGCRDWMSTGTEGSTIEVEAVDEQQVGLPASCGESHPLLCYEK